MKIKTNYSKRQRFIEAKIIALLQFPKSNKDNKKHKSFPSSNPKLAPLSVFKHQQHHL